MRAHIPETNHYPLLIAKGRSHEISPYERRSGRFVSTKISNLLAHTFLYLLIASDDKQEILCIHKPQLTEQLYSDKLPGKVGRFFT